MAGAGRHRGTNNLVGRLTVSHSRYVLTPAVRDTNARQLLISEPSSWPSKAKSFHACHPPTAEGEPSFDIRVDPEYSLLSRSSDEASGHKSSGHINDEPSRSSGAGTPIRCKIEGMRSTISTTPFEGLCPSM